MILVVSFFFRGDKASNVLRVFDSRGTNEPIKVIEKLHYKPAHLIKFNPVYEVVVSTDKSGMIEYWSGASNDYKFPKNVHFESKMDTDLYEFAKLKAVILSITFSKDGRKMATMSDDRKIRIFNFLSGKTVKTIDESLDVYSNIQQVIFYFSFRYLKAIYQIIYF